ncbi:hypothetical protein LZ32DRAFT_173946 [Colletotrichum eremochloae]|nr:hypothetical protein LZ32DRAFT_173946 [Colletotrichum eremochloae]
MERVAAAWAFEICTASAGSHSIVSYDITQTTYLPNGMCDVFWEAGSCRRPPARLRHAMPNHFLLSSLHVLPTLCQNIVSVVCASDPVRSLFQRPIRSISVKVKWRGWEEMNDRSVRLPK